MNKKTKIAASIIIIISTILFVQLVRNYINPKNAHQDGPPHPILKNMDSSLNAEEYYGEQATFKKSAIDFILIEDSGQDNYKNKNETNPTDETVAIASKIISDKIGKDFFDKYIKYNQNNSWRSDNNRSRIEFVFTDPSKGIDKKNSIPISLDFADDSNIEKYESDNINVLPDCRDIQKCNFINHDKIMQYIMLDFQKAGLISSSNTKVNVEFRLNQSIIFSDLDPSEHNIYVGPVWYFTYDIPQLPECNKPGFNVGTRRRVMINAITGRFIHEFEPKSTCIQQQQPV